MKVVSTNVGTVDRLIRILGGAALVAYGYSEASLLLGIIGGIALFTGLIASCPAYRILGIKTCK